MVEYLPLHLGNNNEVATQFEMKYVEEIGLVKFVLLGLRNLTVIQSAMDMIENQGKTPPDMIILDMNDSVTFRLLCSGDTTGVFQLESSGMKELLTSLHPERFEDITALVALYRPGPLECGMVKNFMERKHGRAKVEYPLPELEPILKETYGVILYQEQVMKIAAVLANYSMADADGLRKAIAKKDQALMAMHRDLLLKGDSDNGIDPDKGRRIFDLMEKFGGYGFNKSHTAAYALIAYQTAYLKAHFPVEFLVSLINANSFHYLNCEFVHECRKLGYEILPLNIYTCGRKFEIEGNRICFGLAGIDDLSGEDMENLMNEREKNPFQNFQDFYRRTRTFNFSRQAIVKLIQFGAFDGIEPDRSSMMNFDALVKSRRSSK